MAKFTYSTFVMTTAMRIRILIMIKNVSRLSIITKPKFKEGNNKESGKKVIIKKPWKSRNMRTNGFKLNGR